MSIVQPEIEYVDRAIETIRYLEHGWPTQLCRWHSHAEYELHLIVATRGKAFVGDYIGEFRPGSLFLTGPNLPHNWITDTAKTSPPVELRDMMVQFSQENIAKLSEAFSEFHEMNAMFELAKSGIEFIGFDQKLARKCLEDIRETRGSERIVLFLKLLVHVNEHSDKKPLSVVTIAQPEGTSRQARIGDVVDYITNNFSKDFSLDFVAEMAGMSTATFSRNFQRITGNKFVEFVNRVRISQACSMLYATDEQISAICIEVGFQNLANFNRHFLKLKHMTPSAYRELAQSELATKERVSA